MPILAGGGDLIWVVVVVGSIISQIIKARKNAADTPPKSQTRQSGGGGRDFVAPNDELRDFLKSIGAPTPPPVNQTPVQKPVQRRAQPVQVRHAATNIPPPLPAQSRIKHKPSPLEIKREQQQKKSTSHRQPLLQKQPIITEVESMSTKKNPLTRMIKKELQNLDDTRKSIVLREILGPPIALRQPQ